MAKWVHEIKKETSEKKLYRWKRDGERQRLKYNRKVVMGSELKIIGIYVEQTTTIFVAVDTTKTMTKRR